MSRTIERMQRRILNREAKEHSPLHSHPKYTIPFSISRFESPKLKIHENLIREFAFEFLTDYHRFPYYGIQQRFQTPFHWMRVFPSRRTKIGSKLACVTGRPSRYWQPTLRILGTSRKKRRATLLTASLGCKIRPPTVGNMYPVCHVALRI